MLGNDGNERRTIEKSGAVVWPIQRVLKRLEYGSEDRLYTYGVLILSE